MGGVAKRRIGEVSPLRKHRGRVHPVRGTEQPGTVGRGRAQAQIIGKRHDAAAAIAAHHAAGSIGVVELHDKIGLRIQRQNHEPVGVVLPAQLADARRLAEGIHPALAPVQHHKVVTGAGKFIQHD